MKEHRSKKSYKSRLTRWVENFQSFNFEIETLTGTRRGLVDYISREPNLI